MPTLGDWCTIHAIDERGAPRLLAGAHRDPARDLLVRVLCEHDDRQVPFGMPAGAGLEPVEVTEEVIRSWSLDDEHQRLYHALRPTWIVQVPLRAAGRLAGVITLSMSREYARTFDQEDIRYARELGDRAAFAIGAGRVFHEAREADRRYRLLFDANPQPMWVFDVATLEFLAVNDAAIRRYGYSREEFLSMNIMDLQPADDSPGLPMAEADRPSPRGRLHPPPAERRNPDGRGAGVAPAGAGRPAGPAGAGDRHQRAGSHPRRACSTARSSCGRSSVSTRWAVWPTVWPTTSTTSSRRFAASATSSYRQLAEDDPRRTDAEQIRKAADRGVLLTGQLLSFGQRRMPEPQLLDLHRVIHSMEGLIRRLLGADIQLDLRLLSETAMLRMDPGHLEQLLVNLILNARDAMPHGGILTVETAERQIGAGARGRRVRPGRYVLLAIRDTGTETDSEPRDPPFEPFHGADPRRQRAGLGLSIVYGIVRQSGGAVRVSSEPGLGTAVKVYLPMAEPEVARSEPTDSLRGSETVLVVEDEDGVRELVRQILVEHGHPVLTARHGRDAMLLAERYERPIDLLVTDVVMPEMGGGELVDRLTELRPDLKVLFISGYTNDEVLRRGVKGAGTSLLHKPFTSEGLMRRVREVLRGGGPPTI